MRGHSENIGQGKPCLWWSYHWRKISYSNSRSPELRTGSCIATSVSKKKLNWGSNRYAELRSGSGYDVSVVARWLQDVLAGHDNIYPEFCTLLWALNSSMEIMYSGSWYLTEQDRSRIRTLGSVFMRVYLRLANDALSQNKFLWKCRPKLHLLHHIFRCHRKVNPSKYSTWMDEDWLRKISKTLRLVDCTTAPQRVLQRWLLTLPLQLQRSMETQWPTR